MTKARWSSALVAMTVVACGGPPLAVSVMDHEGDLVRFTVANRSGQDVLVPHGLTDSASDPSAEAMSVTFLDRSSWSRE